MSTTRMRRSGRNIFRTKNHITNKILKSIHVWVFASMAADAYVYAQFAEPIAEGRQS
jgi:predicted transcriptional regulator